MRTILRLSLILFGCLWAGTGQAQHSQNRPDLTNQPTQIASVQR